MKSSQYESTINLHGQRLTTWCLMIDVRKQIFELLTRLVKVNGGTKDWSLRASLDYNEEVHQSVKNFNPSQDNLRQQLIWQTRWKKKKLEIGIAEAVKFLVRRFEVAQETRPSKNSPSKICCHVGWQPSHFSHQTFAVVLDVVLICGWWRSPFRNIPPTL